MRARGKTALTVARPTLQRCHTSHQIGVRLLSQQKVARIITYRAPEASLFMHGSYWSGRTSGSCMSALQEVMFVS